ncbi:MAG TPA: S4 domain-containing protein, partial [Gallionella sp.]|nr:S4 domain-containing protein [Gallionella sp.]
MTESEKNLRDYSANPPSPDALHFVVPDDSAGLRLDLALAKLLPEYSRSRLQEWIASQQVRLDGEFATSKQKVWGGERLEVLPQLHPAEQPYQAEDIAL